MKVLVFAPFPPRGDGRHGGARALASLHRRLAGRHEVVLLALRRDGEPDVDPELAAACTEVVVVKRPLARSSPTVLWTERRRVLDVLRRTPGWAIGTDVSAFHAAIGDMVDRHRPDLVHAEFAVMARYARDVRLPVVLTDHSVAGDDLDDFRRQMYPALRSVVCLTERDAAELRSVVDNDIRVIPLGVEIPAEPVDDPGPEPSLLFVGNFEHPPNVEALRSIVDGVLPAVRTHVPSAELVIVGSSPPQDLVGRPGVTAAGEVESVDPYLRAATAVLAPVWSGGGMRVKVLEALAAGKAVASTPLGVDGLGLRTGEHAVVADDEAGLARAIVGLLEDPERRRRIGAAGRAFVTEHFSWDRIAPMYDAVYDEVAG